MKARKSFAGADCFPDGAVWIWGHFLSDCPGKYFSADSVGGHPDLRRFFDDLYKPGRAGKLLGLKAGDVEKADGWFQKTGTKAVFFCRCVPVVRSLISIPAGMSRMKLPRFFLYTAAGSAIWNILLVSLGAFLGESCGYIAYLAGEYSHIMLIILSISAVSGILWLLGNKKRDDF